jgi:glycogen debranching enzyme
MDDSTRIQDEYYTLVTSALADERTRVLKHADTFAVFDHYGDIGRFGPGEQGLYHEGTRYLSRLELRLGNTRPLFLSSTVKRSNDMMLVDLTNPDVPLDEGSVLKRGTVHLLRSKLLWGSTCHERLRLANHGLAPIRLTLSVRFAADFADIFEVRGTKRERRGEMLPALVDGARAVLGYRGLDGRLRRTSIELAPAPLELTSNEAAYELRLDPQRWVTITIAIVCEADAPTARLSFEQAVEATEASTAATRTGSRISSSNEAFDAWVDRSWADLHMMITETEYGAYPYAGVPWFSTQFGRDGILTAMEILWLEPRVARGVLANLAALQATEEVPERDAEPGKILHEARKCEMAALGEVPFGRYYGSVDSTPLFVMLAADYYARTGDRDFVASLWPHVEAALSWIERYGDLDRDAFVEYARRTPNGLLNQGWKDSGDSVFHSDGRLAEGPIALVEVQGYAFAARAGAARLAAALGREARARELESQAGELRRQFEERFWSEELGTYVLALDGVKLPCLVRTSNAGHALFSGIASPERAARAAHTLLHEDSFSGWGVRTVSASELRYNPMSYHNGSIWPHDNAMIAAGFARYGMTEHILPILRGLFDASGFLELHRMPELFCGFKRRPGEGPTLYPVACSPQAWAAGAVFMLLQACLGLTVDGPRRQIVFARPRLPEFLQTVTILGLKVGEAAVDLALQRHPHDVSINVLRREGPVEIINVK